MLGWVSVKMDCRMDGLQVAMGCRKDQGCRQNLKQSPIFKFDLPMQCEMPNLCCDAAMQRVAMAKVNPVLFSF